MKFYQKSIKNLKVIGCFFLIICISSCSQNNISPATNTITATFKGNTYKYPVVPSVGGIGSGFSITGYLSGFNSVQIILQNVNKTSGTYNLCLSSCLTSNANLITVLYNNGYDSGENGSVVAKFNNGIATGTFNCWVYGGSLNKDSFYVTGSYDVAY